MRLLFVIVIVFGFCSPATKAKGTDFGHFVSLCAVGFDARTQRGTIPATLSVCRLESEFGSGPSLYVVETFKSEFPPHIVLILDICHSPVMERKGERITVLYTSGANSTCVSEFSISIGMAEHLSTETIAWNDRGRYRTSRSFARYADLLKTREGPNQPPQRNAGSRPSSDDSPASETPSSLGPRG